MRLLVLGGTAWLSATVAAEAARLGHQVTCLARGRSGQAPAGTTLVPADRDQPGAYDAVAGEEWDAVVDVASQPGQVRSAVAALAGQAPFCCYVSSCSVYCDNSTPGQDESAPLLAPLSGDVMESVETYGEAKAACEAHVLRGYGADCCLVVRAGLIGGPGDGSGRSVYWPLRFARPATADARVLVPDTTGLSVQVVDVRDLAAWIVDCAATHRAGIYNAVGDAMPLTDYLDLARKVASHRGELAVADADWLIDRGVKPWFGERSLPLWLPQRDYAGFAARDNAAALAARLSLRPPGETLADTLGWALAVDRNQSFGCGLSEDEERELIAELDQDG